MKNQNDNAALAAPPASQAGAFPPVPGSVPGSRGSRQIKRLGPSRLVYRNFLLGVKRNEIVICGYSRDDQWGVASLSKARALIDKWYAEGAVEY